MNIIKWNCLGFVFLDFYIPYVVSVILNSTGLGLGWTFSIQTIGHVIASPLSGWLTDHFSKSKMVLFGACGRAASYFVFYFAVIAESFAGIMVSEFLLGFTVGFFWIPINAIISDKSNKDNRALAFGRRRYAQGKGVLIGTFMGVGIFYFSGVLFPGNVFLPHSSLIIYGLANMVAGLLFYKKVDITKKFQQLDNSIPQPSDSPQKSVSVINVKVPLTSGPSCVETTLEQIPKIENQASNNHQTGSQKMKIGIIFGIIFLLCALFMSSLNESMVKPFLRIFVIDNIVSDPNIAIFGFIPAGIISLFLAPKIGEIADKFNPTIGFAVVCTLGASVTVLLINTQTLWQFIIVLILDSTLAIGNGLLIENLVSRISITNRGKLFGLKAMAGNFGEITGPITGGLLWDLFTQRTPFIISVFVELSIIPFFLLVLYFLKPHLKEKFKPNK